MDLENLGCPTLKKLNKTEAVVCDNHIFDFYEYTCAVKNAFLLKSWILDNNKIESIGDFTKDVDEGDCGCDHSLCFSSPTYFI